MRILVFGVSGFVGSHVFDKLKDKHLVFGVARKNISDRENVLVADLTKIDQVEKVIKIAKPEVIITCAGLFGRDQDVNLNKVFTGNIFKAANKVGGVKRIVISSSAAVYGVVGGGNKPISETCLLSAKSDYAVSKVDEENVSRELGSLYNIEPVIARIFNPIGKGSNPKQLTPNLLKQVNEVGRGRLDTIEVARLDAKRDFIDISDVATAFEVLATKKLKHDTYNIGSGETTTIEELIKIILGVVAPNSEPKLIQTSDSPEPLFASRADTTRLSEEFGWRVARSLNQSIKEMNSARG